ncbi:MAG: HDOD domain-containing protein [Bacteriovoracia bacterium]
MDDYSLDSLLRPAFSDQSERLKEYFESLPAFSPATAKIVQLSGSLNASPSEIVGAIRLDPVLTGRVLELVNSAYFSLAERVTSLNRAVVYLGLNTIKNLALSVAVMRSIGGKDKLKELIFPAWSHSLTTAACARGLAKASKCPPEIAEEFFIAGLLHFVGRIVLIQAFQDTHPHDWNLSRADEKNLFGTDHCSVGGDLLNRWKFSEEMVRAVRTYSAPDSQEKLPHALNLASAMAERLEQADGTRPSSELSEYSQASLEVLGISEGDLEVELQKVPEIVKRASAFLGGVGSA